MQSGATALRKVDPYHLLFEGGQWYLVGHSHERGAVRVFRLSRIRGKVAYSTKAEHDFQRPADFDPRGFASRIPWQLGDAGRHRRGVGLGEDRLVRRAPVRRLRHDARRRRPRRRPDLPHGLRDPAPARRPGRCASATRRASAIRPSSSRSRARGWTRSSSATAARRSRPSPTARRPRAAVPEGEAAGRSRGGEAGIRPERFARLVTLATVLIAAGREGRRLPVAEVREQLQISDAGAARGHLRAQRRQLRRRRLRDLRRGAADGRDRGRPRALLGHLRPPRPAAADRGQRAGRGDRPDRRPLRPGRARLRAREDRRRARPRSRRGGPARHLADRRGRDHPPRRDGRARVAPAADRILAPANEDAFSHRVVEPYALFNGQEAWYVSAVDPGKGDDLRQFRLDRIKSAELLDETFERREDLDPVADVGGWPRTGEGRGLAHRARLDLARAGALGARGAHRCWPSCPTAP